MKAEIIDELSFIIVDGIVRDIEDRRGLVDEWYDIAPHIRQDILKGWRKIITETLSRVKGMKIYTFSYPGSWMGGTMMICAGSKFRAFEIFRDEVLRTWPEDFEEMWKWPGDYFEPDVDEIKEGIFYNWDGDY